MSDSKDVTTTNGAGTAVAENEKAPLPEGGEQALERIRSEGRMAVEKKKELNKLTRQLEGLEWGNVKGASLSVATRYAMAELVYITRANPQLHIDILGGRPYLNAQYWADLMNSHAHFIGFEQENISKAYSEQLREQASAIDQEAAQLRQEDAELFAEEIAGLRKEAVQVRAAAREAERRRGHWGVPDSAIGAYETVIRRYTPNAPLEEIIAGEREGATFVQEIREANWAPREKNDPVGKDEPHKTARTRSLRRAAVKAFSAWMEPLEQEIKRLENEIEAEYEVIRSDAREARAELPAAGEAQAVTGRGEPQATRAEGAASLPVETDDEELPVEGVKYLEGCSIFGRDPKAFAQEHLGRLPASPADYAELTAKLNVLAADGDDQEKLL